MSEVTPEDVEKLRKNEEAFKRARSEIFEGVWDMSLKQREANREQAQSLANPSQQNQIEGEGETGSAEPKSGKPEDIRARFGSPPGPSGLARRLGGSQTSKG